MNNFAELGTSGNRREGAIPGRADPCEERENRGQINIHLGYKQERRSFVSSDECGGHHFTEGQANVPEVLWWFSDFTVTEKLTFWFLIVDYDYVLVNRDT